MNPVAEEILMHYGVKFRSGRYPWGSGDNPYQHGEDLLGRVEQLKKKGWTETAENIKKEFGITQKQYRAEKSLAIFERDSLRIETAKALEKDGLGPTEIGRKMGVKESTVRGWIKSQKDAEARALVGTIDFIREQVDKNKMVDVGKDVNKELGIAQNRFELALHALQREGYEIYDNRVEQQGNTGFFTTNKILCVPGTEYKEIYQLDKIHPLNEDQYVSHDGGDTFDKFVYPKSLDSSRIKVRAKDEKGEDGFTGEEKDGIIEIRRGVQDISLGEDHYAQVRILVDGTHYIKGMAVYSDNIPDGVDIVVNSKKTFENKMDHLKKIDEKNPDNPFGALIKAGGQSYYEDKDGNKQLRVINKPRSEGDWTEWKDTLPSQFLAKQNKELIRKQLNLAKADKIAEYEEICSLNNPTLKKHFLYKFADECDSAAVHLKAAALPGQKYHVIIPVNTLKDNEIYAPQYEPGTKLALVRYPHGGTFEIPVLTVNNKNPLAKSWIGEQSIDAVGINKKVADQLSGADFDGDTVMCIPTDDPGGKVKISRRTQLEGLIGFDPITSYPEIEGMKYMKDPVTKTDSTQKEMGSISNLITDMTLIGASDDKLARAVRHSMVVIDAAKHKLDYRRSERENDIKSLKKEFQIKYNQKGQLSIGDGASTLLSRAGGEYTVKKRKGTPKTNIKGTKWYDPNRPEGALIYKEQDPWDLYYPVTTYNKESGKRTIRTTKGKIVSYNVNDPEAEERYGIAREKDPDTGKWRNKIVTDPDTGNPAFTNKAGDILYRSGYKKQTSTQMAETDDAETLVSLMRNPKELLYADYANSMKALANQARKEEYFTKDIEYNAKAKAIYAEEVASLEEKLINAQKNSPRERHAQRQANAVSAAIKEANPDISKKDLSKIKTQTLTKTRSDVGSVSRKNRNIDITDREWEAIQAGAIPKTRLKAILDNADVDALRNRAMPRSTTELSKTQISRIKAYAASNYTIGEIAKKMGKSPSTISKYLKGVK